MARPQFLGKCQAYADEGDRIMKLEIGGLRLRSLTAMKIISHIVITNTAYYLYILPLIQYLTE